MQQQEQAPPSSSSAAAGDGKPPAPPKPIKEGRGPWFVLAAAATVAGVTLLGLAQAEQSWLHAWVDSGDDSYPQSLSVGPYGGKTTFLDKVDQPMDPAWCGGSSDNPAPATEWCSRVNGIKGMTLSAILVSGAAAIAFLFFLGRSPKSIRAIYAATSFFAAVAVALSIWLWLDVKEGFCQSVLPGFRVFGGPFRCDLDTGFSYVIAAGPLFLLAGVSGLLATHYTEPGKAASLSSSSGTAQEQPPATSTAAASLPVLKEGDVNPAESNGNGNGTANGAAADEEDGGPESSV